jgi:hypothetical protein
LLSEGKLALAAKYISWADDNYQWQKPRLLDAFPWPEPARRSSVDTDVVLFTDPAVGKLGDIAHSLADRFRADPATTFEGEEHLRTTIEDCYLLEGRERLGKGFNGESSENLMFLFLHRGSGYFLVMRGPAGIRQELRPLSIRMANSFRFS